MYLSICVTKSSTCQWCSFTISKINRRKKEMKWNKILFIETDVFRIFSLYHHVFFKDSFLERSSKEKKRGHYVQVWGMISYSYVCLYIRLGFILHFLDFQALKWFFLNFFNNIYLLLLWAKTAFGFTILVRPWEYRLFKKCEIAAILVYMYKMFLIWFRFNVVGHDCQMLSSL